MEKIKKENKIEIPEQKSNEIKQKNKKRLKKPREDLTNLDLLMLADEQDVEALTHQDFEEKQDFKKSYKDFYDDVKQKNNFIKEDW
jgi:hypothetical protein